MQADPLPIPDGGLFPPKPEPWTPPGPHALTPGDVPDRPLRAQDVGALIKKRIA